ncbi:MAG: nucleotidyltransferase family protein [Blastocatellia bacterium]
MHLREVFSGKREEVLRIAARHGACNVRIFGSVARGEEDQESDLDVLVDMEPGRSLFDLGGFLTELQELFGGRVDVVTEQGLRPRIRERVLREAVPL